MKEKRFLIVGSGFSGSVIAERLSKTTNCKIIVIDQRSHVGGNCHTERDKSSGVMIHSYGPHIFNTSNEDVWQYIQQFSEFVPFTNRVKAVSKGNIYSMPINLHTINQFFGKAFSPNSAQDFINSIRISKIAEPISFEEQALKFIGKELYEAFLKGYTKKQWGCDPSKLPASILKRLPLRFNYDDNYYSSKYQGIPKYGYTPIFEALLDSPNIELSLNTEFNNKFDVSSYDHVIYTGPIDAFFDYKYGRLGYRTVYFERGESVGDFQGNAVINYNDESIPFTRIHEHKHFTPWEVHEKTVYFKEFSKETGCNDIPYYPKRLSEDIVKLQLYEREVLHQTKFTFLGRLATYRYMDMHNVIEEALRKACCLKHDEKFTRKTVISI